MRQGRLAKWQQGNITSSTDHIDGAPSPCQSLVGYTTSEPVTNSMPRSSPSQTSTSRLAVAVISNHFSEVIRALSQHADLKLVIGVQAPPKSALEKLGRRLLGWWRREISLPEWALRHGLAYETYSAERQSELARCLQRHNVDLLISYTAPFLGQEVIEAPKLSAVNIHPSPLPAYRGGNPLLWQVIDGVQQSAVSIHRLSPKLDCGDILTQTPYALSPGHCRDELMRRMERVAAQAIVDLVRLMESGQMPDANPQQSNSPTANAYNRRRHQLASLIDWQAASSEQLFGIVGYLGYWPPEIAAPPRWRSVFSYRPRRPLSWTPSRPLGLSTQGLMLIYQSQAGALELVPELSPLALLRHARQRRRQRRGLLQHQTL